MRRLIELRDQSEKKLLNKLIEKYHKQGLKLGLARSRHFVYVEEYQGIEYWIAGAILQDPAPFYRALIPYKVDITNSYFIRRITRLCPYHKYMIEFIHELAKKIANEGKELLITFGLEHHTNQLYRKAGFKEIGKTKKNQKPIYILELKQFRQKGF